MDDNAYLLTSVANVNRFRSPPDIVNIRLFATSFKPTSRSKTSIRSIFCVCVHFRSNFSSLMKCMCSWGVNVSKAISNCGTKQDTFIIDSGSITLPLSEMRPFSGPRKRCDILARSVVLPAPLAPKIATNCPLFRFPLTLMQKETKYIDGQLKLRKHDKCQLLKMGIQFVSHSYHFEGFSSLPLDYGISNIEIPLF